VVVTQQHWGCNPKSYGSWGAPISANQRGKAGTPNQAAIILRDSYYICHNSWRGAISRFRCGYCNCPTRFYSYVNRSMSMIRRVYDNLYYTPELDLR
jgi:hypothetical protein